ncbi:hypothetical protein ACWKSP_22420 [Micromonosporaceae bacterium Da 78-11]
MGFELRREIRDLMPRGSVLTDKECRLILELADNANDETRRAWPGIEWLADACDIPNPKRVGEFLTSIARKWVELRVEIGKDRHGKPYFAKSGHQTVYRLPTRLELMALLGPGQVPPTPGLDARKDPAKGGAEVPAKGGAEVPAKGGAEVPAKGGAEVPPKGGPFSSRSPQSSTSKLSSSLSPREDEAPAPPDVASEPERETDEASQEPETIKTNPVHTLLVGAGCPEDLAEDMERELRRRNNVRAPGPAWFRTVDANEELVDHVTDALEAFQPTSPGEQLADAHEFEPKDDGSPACQRCPFPEPNRRHKVGNQGGGYVAQQGGAGRNQKRSTGVLRAEQTLTVATDLDQRFPNGIRSPADQRVADAMPLYEKYLRLEESA